MPHYARGGVRVTHAETIVVFRGREIGVFYDWYFSLSSCVTNSS